MKSKLLPLLLLLCSFSAFSQSQPLYIESFKTLAIQEMERTGIPASITLAQGILESAWGKGVLARSSNNHFGIKCKSDWLGTSVYLEDDDYNADGELIQSCFRGYETVEASYIDHSNFLINNKRYAPLFELAPTDYKGWAKGLQSCGYATDPKYAEKLVKRIEDYELYQYDQEQEPALMVMEAPAYEIPDFSQQPLEEVTPEEGTDEAVTQEVISEAKDGDETLEAVKQPHRRMTMHGNFGLVSVAPGK